MKTTRLYSLVLGFFFAFSFSMSAQVPKVYCTYWTGSREVLATLNFENQVLDSIGAIPGAEAFPVAAANGYDPYRNRYYVLSNQGLQAVDAATGAEVALASQFAAEPYKHLAYNPVTDQLYLTRFNGTNELFFLVSPEDFSIQGQGVLPFTAFALGCYGLDPVANQVLFHGFSSPGISSIATLGMANGEIQGSFNRPAYIPSPMLPAYDPVNDRYYGVGVLGAGRTALLEFRKTDFQIDTLGLIPGVSSLGIAGSAIDLVNRRYIFYSNLAITSVSLSNPGDVQTIPLPPGVGNVKGFQTNLFAAPPVLPRPNGEWVSVFKYVSGWYHNGNLIPNTANLQSFTPSQAGQYFYRITRPNGEWADSQPFSVSSVSADQTAGKLRLYPNPARGTMKAEGSAADPTFHILDVQGKSVQTGKLNPSHTSIDLRGLLPGLYQFRSGRQSERFVVE